MKFLGYFTSTYHHMAGNELNDVSDFPSVNQPTNQPTKQPTKQKNNKKKRQPTKHKKTTN
jgi:hypothetical protein